jgi:glycosyltransferase involved in cell wall biosynthesis
MLTKRPYPDGRPILFAYSYAARSLLRFARERGWMTILGQIDPGPVEEAIVVEQYRAIHGNHASPPQAVPAYWAAWREELELADRVVVNSDWSAECVAAAGVASEKLRIVPLALGEGHGIIVPPKSYPVRFSAERPLRVLFLGQANIRKGIHIVYDAFAKLAGRPVKLTVVGNEQIPRPAALVAQGSVAWLGRVRRDEVDRHYQASDVFLFPTFSDGFGITQLEAQTWRLPLIVSKRCGSVVRHGKNGIILDELSADAIVSAIDHILEVPERLRGMSEQSGIDSGFTFSGLWDALQEAVEV